MRFFSREERRSYRYLLAWLIIALFSGLLGALVVPGFSFLFQSLARFLQSLEGVPLWLIPLGGALLVGAIVYRLEPRAKGEGIPSYLHAMRKENGHLPFSETFYKFWAALITLGTFGNGGILGPIGRINAGLMSLASKMLPKERLLKQDYALFPICGLAAALGALVHSSIGAGIFAVEIIQKSNMSYRQLFPAILASSASVFFSQSFGLSPVLGFSTIPEAIDLRISGLVLLVALLAGLLGRGYIFLYSKISRLFSRDEHESAMKTTVNVAIGGLGSFLLVYYLHPQLIGTSSPLFNAVLTGNLESIYGNLPDFLPLVLVGFILIILKALANSLTVGSGLSAGFAGPAMLMGLLLGMGMAQLFGVPFSSPEYLALLTAGFAGVLSSTMNTPIAAGVMVVEIFGLHYSLSASLGAIIGFQVNRHNTLYDMALEEWEDDLAEELIEDPIILRDEATLGQKQRGRGPEGDRPQDDRKIPKDNK